MRCVAELRILIRVYLRADTTPPAAPSSRAYPVSPTTSARARACHLRRLLRIAQQVEHASREFLRLIRQRAISPSTIGQTFRAEARRNHRNPRRESLQQFHPHSRPAQNRANEHRIARQRLAHIFDEPDQIDRLGIREASARRRIRADHDQPTARLLCANLRKHLPPGTSSALPDSADGGSCPETES